MQLFSVVALALPAFVAAQYGYQPPTDPSSSTTTTSSVPLPSNIHLVHLGVGNAVSFTPTTLSNVAKGDTIVFQVDSTSQVQHGLVQSDPTAPCTELADGFNSGLMSPGMQWALAVNTTDPVYMFCPQYAPIVHCESQMVFIINPPSADAITSFMSAASAVTSEATQTAPQSSGSGVVETSIPTQLSSPSTGSGSTGSGSGSSGAMKGSVVTAATFLTVVMGLFVTMA